MSERQLTTNLSQGTTSTQCAQIHNTRRLSALALIATRLARISLSTSIPLGTSTISGMDSTSRRHLCADRCGVLERRITVHTEARTNIAAGCAPSADTTLRLSISVWQPKNASTILSTSSRCSTGRGSRPRGDFVESTVPTICAPSRAGLPCRRGRPQSRHTSCAGCNGLRLGPAI